MAYDLFKFLHVAAAIVWVGGVSTLMVFNARLARSSAASATQATLARTSGELGRLVIGPAALFTLLAGVGTAVIGGISLGSLWITWGFTGLFLSMGLAGTVIRRSATALELALSEPATPPARVATLRGRLTGLNLLNLVLLLSVVAAMVFKPAL